MTLKTSYYRGPVVLSLSIPLLSSVCLWVTVLGAAAAATASYTGFNRGLEGTVTLVVFFHFCCSKVASGGAGPRNYRGVAEYPKETDVGKERRDQLVKRSPILTRTFFSVLGLGL